MKQVTKTISMLSLAFLVVITTAFAGTNTVKPESKTELFSRFGNINNVTWIQSDHYSKASFVSDGEQVNAFFENDGSFIGSSKMYSLDKLDTDVQETLNKKYLQHGYRITESIAFTNDEDVTTYNFYLVSAKDKIVVQVSDDKNIIVLKG